MRSRTPHLLDGFISESREAPEQVGHHRFSERDSVASADLLAVDDSETLKVTDVKSRLRVRDPCTIGDLPDGHAALNASQRVEHCPPRSWEEHRDRSRVIHRSSSEISSRNRT